jgi:hypothetical protein
LEKIDLEKINQNNLELIERFDNVTIESKNVKINDEETKNLYDNLNFIKKLVPEGTNTNSVDSMKIIKKIQERLYPKKDKKDDVKRGSLHMLFKKLN